MPKGAFEGWGGARPLVVELGFILGRVSGPGDVVRQLSSQHNPCGRSASRGWGLPRHSTQHSCWLDSDRVPVVWSTPLALEPTALVIQALAAPFLPMLAH